MISWDRVNELREEVGEDDFAEVVSLFLQEVDEVMSRLRSSPDPATYEEDLHFLKGSALNLGFGALGSICRDKELVAADNPIINKDLEEIISVYEASKALFLERSVPATTH